MPKQSTLPTIAEAVERALAEVQAPTSIHALLSRILTIRPSKANNPTGSIRTHLRELEGRSVVYLDSKTVSPLRVAAVGVRFRIPLSNPEVDQLALTISPGFDAWMSHLDDPQSFELIDDQDNRLPTKIVTIQKTINVGPLASHEVQQQAFHLADWFRAQCVSHNDEISVTIESWEPKRFRLALEKAFVRRHHRDEIAGKNLELADMVFSMLESAVNEQIYVQRTIPTAYLRLSHPKGYPGDHWSDVLNNDPRLQFSPWDVAITYPQQHDFFELFGAPEELITVEQQFTPEQENQVYAFKVAFKHRSGLWRRIEIQGKQTLADFNGIIRKVFNHESGHLGGFWKLVRRGSGRRFREIDLGDVDPLGGGEGADVQIASLELEIGSQIKYVYDFGDWIEHSITLETIQATETDTQYPRIASQNKPRYRYCQDCKGRGDRTVADYVCIDCSNQAQQVVLVCIDCLQENHEDHYGDEVIY